MPDIQTGYLSCSFYHLMVALSPKIAFYFRTETQSILRLHCWAPPYLLQERRGCPWCQPFHPPLKDHLHKIFIRAALMYKGEGGNFSDLHFLIMATSIMILIDLDYDPTCTIMIFECYSSDPFRNARSYERWKDPQKWAKWQYISP